MEDGRVKNAWMRKWMSEVSEDGRAKNTKDSPNSLKSSTHDPFYSENSPLLVSKINEN